MEYLRKLLEDHGLNCDGGPQFESTDFQKFLTAWGIHHRLSSVEHPQSYGRAELAVKTVKHIFLENKHDSLDRDKVAHALLQYCNKIIQNLGLTQVELLF